MFIIRKAIIKRDLDGICEAFIQGFFSQNNGKALKPLIKDILPGFTKISDCVLVAECENEARAFLFGNYGRRKNILNLFLFALQVCLVFFKYVFNVYSLSISARQELQLFVKRAFRLFPLDTIKSDAEVLNLTSQTAYRKGIGTALMDEFVRYCKLRGCKTIKVATESIVNYRFYEKYGFKLMLDKDMGIKELTNRAKIYVLSAE